MLLYNLKPTQEGVRDWTKLESMAERAKYNQYFMSDKPIIINNVEGSFFVTDGHHRCIAKLLAGISFLDPSEYVIKQFSLKEMIEPSIENGWIAPFNPFEEVRLSNLAPYFNKIKKVGITIENIKKYQVMYKRERLIYSFIELASKYGL